MNKVFNVPEREFDNIEENIIPQMSIGDVIISDTSIYVLREDNNSRWLEHFIKESDFDLDLDN